MSKEIVEVDKPDEIITYDAYNTVVAANLVKTKLDAYGVPCFLVDENFVNMEGVRNKLFPGIRLFIFENDKNRVDEILREEINLEGDPIICPKCNSHDIKVQDRQLHVALRLVMGIFLSPILATLSPSFRSYHCATCNHTWE